MTKPSLVAEPHFVPAASRPGREFAASAARAFAALGRLESNSP